MVSQAHVRFKFQVISLSGGMSLLLVQVSVQRTRSTQCQHLPDLVGAAPSLNEATYIRLLNDVLSSFDK